MLIHKKLSTNEYSEEFIKYEGKTKPHGLMRSYGSDIDKGKKQGFLFAKDEVQMNDSKHQETGKIITNDTGNGTNASMTQIWLTMSQL